MWFKQAILYTKAALSERLEQPLAELAGRCAAVWEDVPALELALAGALAALPHCQRLYACAADGRQLSADIGVEGNETLSRGRLLADRPYHAANLPYRGHALTSVFLDEARLQRAIAAIQAVTDGETLRGFLVAEFLVDDLPQPQTSVADTAEWTQYRGDPAIRESVFNQCRTRSPLDLRIDEVVDTLDALMREHGIYHVILHFSSSRAIFWVFDDPYSYRFHGVDEILDPEIWLAYPGRPYPKRAVVSPPQIRQVLERFRVLREGDEVIYLRSASLNIMNGIIGLTFSCDGSHYITVEEFLNAQHPFWG